MVKQYQNARSGKKMTPTVAYIQDFLNNSPRQWENNIESIILGFKEVSVGKIKLAVENLEKLQSDGKSNEVAWNMTHIELTECAEVSFSKYY